MENTKRRRKTKYALVPEELFKNNCKFISAVYRFHKQHKTKTEKQIFETAKFLSKDIQHNVDRFVEV